MAGEDSSSADETAPPGKLEVAEVGMENSQPSSADRDSETGNRMLHSSYRDGSKGFPFLSWSEKVGRSKFKSVELLDGFDDLVDLGVSICFALGDADFFLAGGFFSTDISSSDEEELSSDEEESSTFTAIFFPFLLMVIR